MVIESDTLLQLAYGFLLPTYSNFVSKMHRFRDMATYWSKIAENHIHHSHLARSVGVTHCEFFNESLYTLPETRIMGLSDGVHFTIMLSLF